MFNGALCRWVFCAAFIGTGLQAGTVVVGQPPLNGTGNCDPFGCPALFGLGTYQQVYASTAFPSPLTIATVSFYDTQVHSVGTQALGTFTLSFAYTSKAPGMLDLTNPSNNITSGSQTFYAGMLPNLATGNGTPSLIVSGTPFAYNPANGNLLLTVVVSTPVDQPTLLYLDQAAATNLTTNAYFGVVKSGPVSGGNDIGGLVTGFASSSLLIAGPASLATGTVGMAYGPVSFTATGGTGGYSWSATGLPNGLTVNASGVLSGTPAAGSQANYNPQFTVTDSNNDTASVSLPLLVNPAALQITGPASLPAGAVGVAYGPVTFGAAGGAGGYSWSATGLPNGLSLSVGGVLSGAPAAGSQGSYNPQFTLTDSSHTTLSVTLPLPINASLQITGPVLLPFGFVGTAYSSVTFAAAGGTGGDLWSATGLPNGLLLSTGGVLSGNPAPRSLGIYLPHFTVTDSSGSQSDVIRVLVVIPKL
jgi:hypothetical protein